MTSRMLSFCVFLLLQLDSLFVPYLSVFFFFFTDTATTEIYTLSLHDALPIATRASPSGSRCCAASSTRPGSVSAASRSEEHTSELQSPDHLASRPPPEKKKKTTAQSSGNTHTTTGTMST